MKNSTRKRPIVRSRATAPEIYVKAHNIDWRISDLKRAHIRVRAGEYQYLQWRDGDKVRSFYLGRKRKA
jgi:hypothetical protein